ncbi:MAG: hypothetical protein K0R46_857 [Herbinix sp.]|nr:hypothetical protein [Herbinix sp.]
MSNRDTNNKATNSQKDNRMATSSKVSGARNKSKTINEDRINYFLLPILIILCIIPFIVRMNIYNTHLSQYQWFAQDGEFIDFFLIYKHWAFVVVSIIMVVIIAIRAYYKRDVIKFLPLFIPLGIYGVMALLSAIFSDYPLFSFGGGFEQFESIFAILGYCITAYYAFLFIREEQDLKKILKYLVVTAIIMSILGVFQFAGNDLFREETIKKLIIPLQYQDKYSLNFGFENNRVYFTLYNPNYVGVFVSMMIPILLVMLFFHRNIKKIIISIVAIIGLIIGGIGAQSLAGVVGLAVALLFIMILMWRYLIKRYTIVLSVGAILIIGVLILNAVTDQFLFNRIKNVFNNTKAEYTLASMDTKDDCVELSYGGNKLLVRNIMGETDSHFTLTDVNNEMVAANYDASTNSIMITDERFAGISVGVSNDFENAFYIQEAGVKWLFTVSNSDGTYYHMNRFGKLDKMITAPSAIFTGYEWFATARGYLWSRTIPLLKENLILGSGPDTFVMEYPQQDYLNFQRYGYPTNIITKPHNLYLQIAVQDGMIALLAFLAFYAMYFISSIRLYIKGRFHNFYEQMGVAIFVGTIGYMVTGLTNDSSITTAPIFWALMGIGISVNYRVKSLNTEEQKKS